MESQKSCYSSHKKQEPEQMQEQKSSPLPLDGLDGATSHPLMLEGERLVVNRWQNCIQVEKKRALPMEEGWCGKH